MIYIILLFTRFPNWNVYELTALSFLIWITFIKAHYILYNFFKQKLGYFFTIVQLIQYPRATQVNRVRDKNIMVGVVGSDI